ncbi:extensin-like [Pyrus ussuriensis x Pyrus communis]|uniref:Extensin-like n=1 Tax=Pyrus ussuriensis x Pyrus communis TaxID=2448454 RepID=A0A5N5G670_9ROSA|nr:extensin-like [Pyrus ussuriensis x Pyrus communis]
MRRREILVQSSSRLRLKKANLQAEQRAAGMGVWGPWTPCSRLRFREREREIDPFHCVLPISLHLVNGFLSSAHWREAVGELLSIVDQKMRSPHKAQIIFCITAQSFQACRF